MCVIYLWHELYFIKVTDNPVKNEWMCMCVQDGNFIMSFEHLHNGRNELVLHVDSDRSSKVCNWWIVYVIELCVFPSELLIIPY